MKSLYQFLLFFLLIALTSQSLQAQYYDQAVGLRAGTSLSASYKKFFSYHPNLQMAWEVLGGVQLDEIRLETNGYVVEGVWYAHMDLGFDTGFSGFAGAGIFMGVYTPPNQRTAFGGGLAFVLGASYTFTHTPLNVQLDWKPILSNPRTPSLTRGAITFRYVIPTTWQ
jgi:hypothetical protein